jgi:hypothetical protein
MCDQKLAGEVERLLIMGDKVLKQCAPLESRILKIERTLSNLEEEIKKVLGDLEKEVKRIRTSPKETSIKNEHEFWDSEKAALLRMANGEVGVSVFQGFIVGDRKFAAGVCFRLKYKGFIEKVADSTYRITGAGRAAYETLLQQSAFTVQNGTMGALLGILDK